MTPRPAVAGIIVAAVSVASVACGPPPAPDPPLPEIIDKAIAYHGGDLYERSRMTMTITSLSGSFQIEATRNGGAYDFVVINPAQGERPERRVQLTNEGVTEWRDGVESELDEEGARRAMAFVNARVFFPLLPYTLKGSDVLFEDRGHRAVGRTRPPSSQGDLQPRLEQRCG